MEIFRELEIRLDPDEMSAMADRIERTRPAGWTRDRAAEPFGLVPRLLTFAFRSPSDERRPAAILILSQKDSGVFSVPNIIPLTRNQLEPGEYNAILGDFFEDVIRPEMASTGVDARLGEKEADLEHWMSHDAAEFLRQFSAKAHRGTNAGHPSDRERWNAFVVAAHRDGSRMEASDLRRWLTEVDRWPPQVADQLAAEYEYGRELLAFADAHRRSA